MTEPLITIAKAWGYEEVIVNNDRYCGKLLHLNKGAMSSLHYHLVKRETFYCLHGVAVLHLHNEDYMLNPGARPQTIMPMEAHGFAGITDAVILEVSTPHSDEDVVRLRESRASEE